MRQVLGPRPNLRPNQCLTLHPPLPRPLATPPVACPLLSPRRCPPNPRAQALPRPLPTNPRSCPGSPPITPRPNPPSNRRQHRRMRLTAPQPRRLLTCPCRRLLASPQLSLRNLQAAIQRPHLLKLLRQCLQPCLPVSHRRSLRNPRPTCRLPTLLLPRPSQPTRPSTPPNHPPTTLLPSPPCTPATTPLIPLPNLRPRGLRCSRHMPLLPTLPMNRGSLPASRARCPPRSRR